MIVKTRKSKVIALVLSLLIALAFMPTITSAATSTGLDFQAGGATERPLKPVLGAQDKNGWGYIAVKAVGGDSDEVVCKSNDESVATVEGAGLNKNGYYKFDVKAVTAGETTITVSAKDNPTVSDEVPVVVAAPSSIYLEWNSPVKFSTAIGAEKGGLIAVYAAGGTEEFGKVICESSDETIATVTATDKQMKTGHWKFDVSGLKEGEVKITVTAVEDPTVQEQATVTVVKDLVTVEYGNLKKGFDIDEFNALPTLSVPAWGGRNHYFTFLEYPKEGDPDSEGPTVESILTAAGVNVDALDDDQLISFIPSDNPMYTATFTIKQILRTPRFYFPNSKSIVEGNIATKKQLEGAVPTPLIICKMDNTESRLVFGQEAPNERSVAHSGKCMSTGGKIIISDQKAKQLVNDVTASISSGSDVEAGKEIKLKSPTLYQNEIYYTLDGSVPTIKNAALYNYLTQGDTPEERKNAKIIPKKPGSFTIKVMQYAYGSNPSKVKTFKYKVSIFTVNGQKYKATKFATSKAKGTVTFTKAKNAKTVTVPATIKLNGKTYNVTAIGANAFKGTKATKVIVKTKKLTKKSVKNSLKGSKVKTVVVKVGTKKQNKTYVKKYKKFFTKANAGKKVTVK